MGEAVGVDVARRRPAAGWVPGADSMIDGASRNGAAGDLGRELRRELAEAQVLAAPLDEPEDGRVPERGRAAVAEHDLVAVGEVQQLGEPVAQRADHEPDRGLAVARAQVVGARPWPAPRPPRGAPWTGPTRTARRGGAGRRGWRSRVWRRSYVCNYRVCDPHLPPPYFSTARRGAIAESATLAVDAKAKALKAAGEPVIGFGAGEPDFPTPAHIVEAAAEACRDPKNHNYTPIPGLPELREAIAAKTKRDSGSRWRRRRCSSPTAASTPSTTRCSRLLDEGDEALLPAPYWTTYPEPVRLAGATPVVLPTDERDRLQGHRRPARGRPHRSHEAARVRVAVEPVGRGVLP